MKWENIPRWSAALCLGAMTLHAQETNEVGQLKKLLQQQQRQIDMLIREVDKLRKSAAAPLPGATMADDPEKPKVKSAAETGLAIAPSPPRGADIPTSWSPSQPVAMARTGPAYLSISFDALVDAGWSTAADPATQLQLGDHDPQKRGFSLRNAEVALDGAVDPYFKGFANIVLKLDNNNQTAIELEEAYLQSTSLPGNLQVKSGQFFAAFGRQNPQHPHAWAFVDSPLISTRAFGPDGLRNIGAQLSWLAPTPFYTELFLGIFDGQGATMHGFRNPGKDDGTGVSRFAGRRTLDRHLRGPQDLVFTPRLATSFEITDTQTLVAGLSGAVGPNDTGAHSRTEIYGADLYWKWKAANAREGFPFVSWQTEALYRRFGAGFDPLALTPLTAENIRDWGAYSQVLWGFRPRWITGLRADFASGNPALFDASDPFRGERWRISPVLTFHPSEFSKLRLQYNYDQGRFVGSGHSVWLQMEFLLGAHGAHKF